LLGDLSSDSTILLLRIAIIVLLYLFIFSVVILTQRELGVELSLRQASSPRSRLIVLDPGTSTQSLGQAIALEPVTRFGRAHGNTVILDDEFVSTDHALVLLKEDRWWVRDAGSTNGTFINGLKVEAETPLREGDELQIGQVRLKFSA
jgi:hypothetical protein